MKVIIFGPGSMVAGALMPRLRGHAQIFTIGRTGADLRVDLSEDTQETIAEAYDAAVICTASFGGDDPTEMILNAKVNALGSLRAAHLAIQAGCRQVIYLSSLFAIEHPENGYFGSYGLSKRQGEENVALLCRRSKVDCAILRVTQLYDAIGRGRRHQPLLYHIIDRARAGEEIVFFGRRDPLRNYLYCDDLAEMIVRMLKCGLAGTYPCVAPESLPLSEIAALAFRTFGTPEKIRFLADRTDIPTVHIPDGSELHRLLGYRPQVDLAQGLGMIRDACRHGI